MTITFRKSIGTIEAEHGHDICDCVQIVGLSIGVKSQNLSMADMRWDMDTDTLTLAQFIAIPDADDYECSEALHSVQHTDAGRGVLSDGYIGFSGPRYIVDKQTLKPYGDADCEVVDIHARRVTGLLVTMEEDPELSLIATGACAQRGLPISPATALCAMFVNQRFSK